MRLLLLAVLLVWPPSLRTASAVIVAPDLALLQEQNRIKADSELRIQRDVRIHA